MSNAKRSYEMRMQGMCWTDIGEALGIKPNSASQAAHRHADRNGLNLPLEERKRRGKKKKFTAKQLHKMHCGKSMRSDAIAVHTGMPIETVRKTLRKYRQEMWG